MADFRADISLLDILTLDGASSTPSPPTDDFWYNNFGLQNSSIVTRKVIYSAPNLALQARGFPRTDGMYAETGLFQANTITLQGTLKAANRAALEYLMDEMKQAFGVLGSQLKITWNGATRYFDNCYPYGFESIFKDRDFYHLTFVPYQVSFQCLNPYGRDANRWVLQAPYAITASPTNFILSNNGTAKTDPIITIAASTAGSLSQMVLLNITTGDTMTVTAAFHDGDSLNIDGEQKIVTLNGNPVDYTGVIPRLNPGDNNLQVSLAGAGYSLAFTEQHYPRWF